MRPTTALLWKEWHAARTYLGIGLGVFLGLPVVGGVEELFTARHRFELSVSPWVLALGGVLAVFAGVGVTTPDLRLRLDDFWRSRPIGVRRWIGVKYAVGLAAVLVACMVPLAVEAAAPVRAADFDWSLLAVLPFFWTAVYSLAFLAGSLVPRPAHAATLALTAMLLVYVLPVVLPPLAWLDMSDVRGGTNPRWLPTPPLLPFAGGMVGLSAIAAAVAVVGVARAWRVEAGRRVLFAGVGGSLLLLFATAAFQLGTNLPILQQVTLPPDERVRSIHLEGPSGYLLTLWGTDHPDADSKEPRYRGFRYRPMSVTAAGLVLGPAEDLTGDQFQAYAQRWYNGVQARGFSYLVSSEELVPDDDRVWMMSLVTSPDDPRRGLAENRLRLWQQPRSAVPIHLYSWDDKIYVIGERLDVVDVSRPGQPRVLSDVPFPDADFVQYLRTPWSAQYLRRGDRLTIRLLPLPGLPPERRLAATIGAEFRSAAFDGHTLCDRMDQFDFTASGSYRLTGNDTVSAYRLIALDDDTATFAKAGEYRPSLLQHLADPHFDYSPLTLSDGRVYFDGSNISGVFNGSISVLDTRGRRPMRMAGHFAAPGATTIYPLPDGRAVVAGGNHLWLVGGPPGRGGD